MEVDEELRKRVQVLSEQVDFLTRQNGELNEELDQMRILHVNTVDYSSVIENELEKKIESLTKKNNTIPHEDDHYKDLRLRLSLEISKNEHLERINKSLMEQLEQFRLLYVNVSAHSTALENDLDERYEEVKRLSITDPLTGAYNRNGFYKNITAELDIRQRKGHPLSLIMFDIDNFKSFNDTFGHEIGDDILKLVAEITTNSIRKSDVFCRWGGEEFLIIVPELSLNNAMELAERIRTNIEHTACLDCGSVTCSFGVAEYNDSESIDECIKRSDIGLYKAKSKGKNRVCRGDL